MTVGSAVTVDVGLGDAITASIDHGVLSLIIPKPERLKPKTIAIGSGSGSGSRQNQLEIAGA